MISPSAQETVLRNQIASLSIGNDSPLTFYSNLLEELRTGRRDHPNKDEFRDLYDYTFLMAQYTNAVLIRIQQANDYIEVLELEVRKTNPDAVLPELTAESLITIDGRSVTIEDLVKILGRLAKDNPSA